MLGLLLTHNVPRRSLERAVGGWGVGGVLGFYSFLHCCLSSLSLSVSSWQRVAVCWVPGGEQKNDFIKDGGGILRPEITQTLVRKRGVLVSLGGGLGGVGGGTTIAAQSDCRSDKKM